MIQNGARLKWMRRQTFAHQLYAKHEQQQPLGGGFTEWGDDGYLRYVYRVPKRTCIGPKESMPLSAVLAIVDEVTTWASMGDDRHMRPGVSISLETELVEQDRPPIAGDVLVFAARVEKMGRSIGFQSCEVTCATSGRRVARGYHVKMLDMGRAWSLAFGPLLPLTESIQRSFLSVERPAPQVDPEDAAELARLIAPTSLDLNRADGTALARYTCEDAHLQETSIMFGGVQAMVHEYAARAAAEAVLAPSGGGAAPSAHCCSLLVRYLASAVQGDELEAHATAAAAYRNEGAVASTRLLKGGHVRSAAELRFVRC